MRRFEEVIEFLKDRTRENLNEQAFETLPPLVKEHNHIISKFIDDMNWLKKEAFHHQTIDTLAKKFYLTENADLKKLKRTLITYFTIEQLLFIPSAPNEDYSFNKTKELRYDSFFAAILEKGPNNHISVKSNIKILTWNYDQQIELALKAYV